MHASEARKLTEEYNNSLPIFDCKVLSKDQLLEEVYALIKIEAMYGKESITINLINVEDKFLHSFIRDVVDNDYIISCSEHPKYIGYLIFKVKWNWDHDERL